MQFPVIANVVMNSQDTSEFEKSTFAHANTECPICLESIIAPNVESALACNITVLNCYHVMCTHCFVTYIQKKHDCPICRESMFTMKIGYNQQTYVIPTATSLGQRIQQVISPQESRTILHQPRFTLRQAPPLRSTRRASRSPVRYYRRRRNMDDYYDEDYDIDMTEEPDNSNISHSISPLGNSGRAAGVAIFILVDITIIAIWLLSLWV